MKWKITLGIIIAAVVAVVLLEAVLVGASVLIFGGIIGAAVVGIVLVWKSKRSGDDSTGAGS